MVYSSGFFTPYKKNQANSALNPKPGFGTPQGNAMPSYLQAQSGGAPTITPKSEVAPKENAAPSYSPYPGGVSGALENYNRFNTANSQNTIAEYQKKYGANWFNEYSKAQNAANTAYLGQRSDAARLAEVAKTPYARGGGLAMSDPGQVGAGGYTLHDINAIKAMNPQEQEQFFGSFADPKQADYLRFAAGLAPATSGQFQPNQPAITPAGMQNQQNQSFDPTRIGSGEKPSLQRLFEFLKSDLERERDLALSESDVDAARRGVFFGTPGSIPRTDIQEKYLRGLGQLESGLIQNETQNELARLGLASSLIPQDILDSGGIDPALFQALGGLFSSGGGGSSGLASAASSIASLLGITPKTKQTEKKEIGVRG